MGFGTEATSGQKENIFDKGGTLIIPNLDQKVKASLVFNLLITK
jgi:hypothetical protein